MEHYVTKEDIDETKGLCAFLGLSAEKLSGLGGKKLGHIMSLLLAIAQHHNELTRKPWVYLHRDKRRPVNDY